MPVKKEEPNTKNVVVWPKGSVPEEARARRVVHRPPGDDADTSRSIASWLSINFQWTEKYDFSLFFFLGSVLWIWLVRLALRWLRFPVHQHPLEVYAFYTLPLVILFIVLYVFDLVFSLKSTSSEIDNGPPSAEKEKLIKDAPSTGGSVADSESENNDNL